jgi:hypothetical protein
MRSIITPVVAAALLAGASQAHAQAAQPTPAEKKAATTLVLPPAPKTLLPDAFAGWKATAPPKSVSDPGDLDAANAVALQEYGFIGAARANYKRDGETLTLLALRFTDLSGAYGAYSFYRQNGWPKADIGDGAASDKNRVLFWKGTTLVDAKFSSVGPTSAGELRELAKRLPAPSGNRALTPPVLAFLPQGSMDKQTTHYAVGPAGYVRSGGVLPPGLAGFDRGAEAATANYSLVSGSATLTIIDFPTPQMAQAAEKQIGAYLKAGSQAQPPWPKPLQDSDQRSLAVRSTGPLVAVVSGEAPPDESRKLLDSVYYSANLTSIPGSKESEAAKAGQLLLGIAELSLIGAAAALLLGFFLGGGRALYRLARGKPISSVFDEEFIRLDLREEWVPPKAEEPQSHPKR